MRKPTFAFWVVYLKTISLFFGLMGLGWLLMGSFDPLGVYDRAFAQAFWGREELPAAAKEAFGFAVGPLGATTFGYFLLQYFIATHAYASRQRWGYQAIVTAFLGWFLTDTLFSLARGAYFNVWFANLPCLLLMLPIFFTNRYFREG